MLRSTYAILSRRKEMYESQIRDHYLKGEKREKKESRIRLIKQKAREISDFLKKSRVIEELEIAGDFITVGSMCKLRRLDNGDYIDIAVLGCADIRFNPRHRYDVSYQSKLGLRLMGKITGTEVEIRGVRYEIEKITKYQE